MLKPNRLKPHPYVALLKQMGYGGTFDTESILTNPSTTPQKSIISSSPTTPVKLPFQTRAPEAKGPESMKLGPTSSSSNGFDWMGIANGVSNIANTALSQDWNNTGQSVENTTEAVVETVLPLIPVVGQVLSIINQVTGPVGSSVAENDPTNVYNMGWGYGFDAVGSFSKGIGEIAEGDWDQGLMNIFAPIGGGIMQAIENKQERSNQATALQRAYNDQAITQSIADNPFLDNEKQVAAFGGPLRKEKPSTTDLSWMDGKSPKEIASLMGLPQSGAIEMDDTPEMLLSGVGLTQGLIRGGLKLAAAKAPKYIGTINIGSHPKSIARATAALTKTAKVGAADIGVNAVSNDKAFGGPLIGGITVYGNGGSHEASPNGGIPVDAQGNPTANSGRQAVALTEEGEVSWINPKTKQTYVFSNRIR